MLAPGEKMCKNIFMLLLAEWARREGIPATRAYRKFHAGDLRDRDGRPVIAEKSGTGSIYVYDAVPPDWLDQISAEAIVKKLTDAGYLVLTAEQGAQLGLVVREVAS
jgi:hypothetical protein